MGSRSIGLIALVPDEWEGVWMPRHQIISRLAGSFDVIWVTPPEDWREYWLPGRSRFLEPQRFVQIGPAFTVMQSGRRWPQIFWPAWLRNRVTSRRLRAARRYLIQRGARQIVLYLWQPGFAAAIDLVQHDASCYHIDDEYSFSDVELPNSREEIELIRRVDQVIVHSTRLMEKKGAINPNTALVPNGVDFKAFATPRAEPADLACVPRPRIGYIGVIKKQLDLALLVRLARARRDWSFVMVGPIANIGVKQPLLADLQALSNVHFLGKKPLSALSAYTQHMDVCLMCYEANDYTKYIYPLKLHEYLASGRPAVATPIDSVVEHSDVVALARSDSEWITAVEQALAQEGESQRCARQERARAYDWATLAGRVADLILARVAATSGSGVTRSTTAVLPRHEPAN